MRRRVLAGMFLAFIGIAACGDGEPNGGGASPSPEAASPTRGAVTEACDPETSTSLSSGWHQYNSPSGSYSFSYPANWQDLTGQVSYVASEIVAEETLSEAGK